MAVSWDTELRQDSASGHREAYKCPLLEAVSVLPLLVAASWDAERRQGSASGHREVYRCLILVVEWWCE